MQERINDLLKKTEGLSAEEILKVIYQEFSDKVSFATSLGEEDQILTHMIAKVAPDMNIFTLDTGRLFQESYDLLETTQKRYPMDIKVMFPNTKDVEEMVESKGINLFYDSIDNRKTCCGIRKIEPLQRALSKVDAWIVGLRAEQSVTRTDLKVVEFDSGNNIFKFNPLINWTYDQMKDYIKEHNIDVNPLHSKGFVSIGCASCTRAIKKGEDIRAGRWWWELPEQKECGLHNNPKRAEYLNNKK
ncbi:MAG: phosphoadenosine phosphosulfate reductase [Lysobacterales bacterium]|jgi:phosphoadenosine phosphosulfate reductase